GQPIIHLSSANSRDPERLRLAWLVRLDDKGDRDAVRSNVVPRVVNATKKPTHNHVRSAQPYLDGLLRPRAGKNPKSRSACGTRHAIHGMLDALRRNLWSPSNCSRRRLSRRARNRYAG